MGAEGLRGVKSCVSEELLSPSDSHSEEVGGEDGGEEEEPESLGLSSTAANFRFRTPAIVLARVVIHSAGGEKKTNKQTIKTCTLVINKNKFSMEAN